MPDLIINTGVQEFTVNGRGALRFNPGDPNLYHRFFGARQTLVDLDAALTAELEALRNDPAQPDEQARAAAALALLAGYDARIKALLNDIFGPGNDFGTLLEGVNLAALSTNGQRVVQNLLDALAPVLQQGAEATVQARAAAAEQQAADARRSHAAVPAIPAAPAAPAGDPA